MADHDRAEHLARQAAYLRALRQQSGVEELIMLAHSSASTVRNRGNGHGLALRHGDRVRREWGSDSCADRRGPVPLAARQAAPGALSLSYEVPAVRYKRSVHPFWVTITGAAIVLLAAHHFVLGGDAVRLLPLWAAGFAMRAVPLAISWFAEPFTVTRRQARALNELRVTVAVPVYNEDPALLDRCLWALVNQSRQPDVIHVVEDGPSGDYAVLREHWLQQRRGRARVAWTQLPKNQGKKAAQVAVFTSHPDADIFVTVDSDTSLEHDALREGLKPFADQGITSVAGVEENFNKGVNWLTRSVAVRNTYYQLTVWGAQSVLGDLLVNRGTFALYRAWIIRECVPAYVGEKFLGRRIKLGDDAALTLFCQWYGRTVQQISAFSLPMQPENLSHHFRQWTRWARGAVIRNCWRLRYLPVRSYGFWWTVMVWYMIFMSMVVPVVLAVTWPQSAHVLEFAGVAVICWTYMVSTRVLAVRREGESAWFRLCSLLLYPVGILWATVILRPVRLYGVATFLKQRWTTRQNGIEDMAGSPLAPRDRTTARAGVGDTSAPAWLGRSTPVRTRATKTLSELVPVPRVGFPDGGADGLPAAAGGRAAQATEPAQCPRAVAALNQGAARATARSPAP